MTCPHCGYMMDPSEPLCLRCKAPNAGYIPPVQAIPVPISSPTPTPFAPVADWGAAKQQMVAQGELMPVMGEQILADGPGQLMKGSLRAETCDVSLSNYRIVLCSKKPSLASMALLGPASLLVAGLKKAKKITLQLLIPEIVSITKTKHALARKFTVEMKSGETHQIQFGEKWEPILATLGIIVVNNV